MAKIYGNMHWFTGWGVGTFCPGFSWSEDFFTPQNGGGRRQELFNGKNGGRDLFSKKTWNIENFNTKWGTKTLGQSKMGDQGIFWLHKMGARTFSASQKSCEPVHVPINFGHSLPNCGQTSRIPFLTILKRCEMRGRGCENSCYRLGGQE